MSEHSHQVAVVDWFKAQYPKYAGCIIAIPNGAMVARDNKRGNMFARIEKLRREGAKKGASDLFIAVPVDGKSGMWVEMKDHGKTWCSVSQEQRDHIELMLEMGYEAIWASGSDIAIAAIKTYMTQGESNDGDKED